MDERKEDINHNEHDMQQMNDYRSVLSGYQRLDWDRNGYDAAQLLEAIKRATNSESNRAVTGHLKDIHAVRELSLLLP